MGRWTQYDEDEYRLPEGMKRIGYDSDCGQYFFKDRQGNVWQGAEGAEYGEMTRVSSLPSSMRSPEDQDDDADVEAASRSPSSRPDGYQLLTDDPNRPMAHLSRVNTSAYRTLFPFFLIIAVVLLLIWRLVVSPGLAAPPKKQCPDGTLSYWIQPGDSCWEISRKHGWTMDKFREANPKVVCDPLMPGTSVCLPPDSKAGRVVVQQKAKAKAALTARSNSRSRSQARS